MGSTWLVAAYQQEGTRDRLWAPRLAGLGWLGLDSHRRGKEKGTGASAQYEVAYQRVVSYNNIDSTQRAFQLSCSATKCMDTVSKKKEVYRQFQKKEVYGQEGQSIMSCWRSIMPGTLLVNSMPLSA